MSKAKKFISTIGFSLLCLPAIAEQSYLAKLAPQSLLLDIQSNSSEVIVVGERGHILRSNDGNNWQQDTVPTLSTLTAVSMVGDQAWAVGHDAVILHQRSKDAPWEVQMFAPELEKPFLDVLFFDAKHGIAVGAYGTFYRTQDAGENWLKEDHPELLHPDDKVYLDEIRLEDEEFYQLELGSIMPHINHVTMMDEVLYLAGEAGLLAKSVDFGQNWQRMEVDYLGSFFDVTASQNGKVVAAGLRGNLFSLDQQSGDWQKIITGNTNSLNSVVFISPDQFVAIGNSGTIICSNDGVISHTQTADGKALLAASTVGDSLLMVSAEGIKHVPLNSSKSLCQGVGSSL